eukprot:TRINITY_DN20885_c0_g1_i2.p1 TRINITY_DN20885_c0_g1~~TRINITY_DN20885_c0_g1_i2.p1  ORF type:complete len:324 (+),score=50.89 TRINITY_DN20885_c0_g1_i2:49-1020(+)
MGSDPSDMIMARDFETMPLVYNQKKGRHEYAFFADRDPKFLNALAQLLTKRCYKKGECIVKEGDVGYNMFFLYSGSVDVYVKLTKVATMQRGCHFGEMALYGMSKRTASVIAREACICLIVKGRSFNCVLKHFPEEAKFFEAIKMSHRSAKAESKNRRRPSRLAQVQSKSEGVSSDEDLHEDDKTERFERKVSHASSAAEEEEAADEVAAGAQGLRSSSLFLQHRRARRRAMQAPGRVFSSTFKEDNWKAVQNIRDPDSQPGDLKGPGLQFFASDNKAAGGRRYQDMLRLTGQNVIRRRKQAAFSKTEQGQFIKDQLTGLSPV